MKPGRFQADTVKSSARSDVKGLVSFPLAKTAVGRQLGCLDIAQLFPLGIINPDPKTFLGTDRGKDMALLVDRHSIDTHDL